MTKKYFIVPDEATLVRRTFETYLKLGSARETAKELNRFGYRRRTRISKRNGNKTGGGELTGSYIYGILNNPVYAGYVKHYDKLYPGEHEAIISKDVWEKTQNLLQVNCPHEGKRTLGSDPLDEADRSVHRNRSMRVLQLRDETFVHQKGQNR